MPQLIAPTPRLHASWLAAHAEWAPGGDPGRAGLWLAAEGDDFTDPEVFAAWVALLRDQAGHARPLPGGRVPTTHWWIAEHDTVLGAIDLRHALDAFLSEAGGHVGYSVRPSARRRGLATWALGAVLPEARALGLDRLLLVCDAANTASARVIVRNGGVLEDVRTTRHGVKNRYWTDL
jgi:predicted acetyltransferase